MKKKELKEARNKAKLAQAIQPIILNSLGGTQITKINSNNLYSINDYPLSYMAKTNTETFKNYMKMSPEEFKSDAINLFVNFDRITRNNLVELLTNSIISSANIIASNWLVNYCDTNREISSILKLRFYLNCTNSIQFKSKISEILYNFIKDYINGYNYNHYETINTVIAQSEFAIDAISILISSSLASSIDTCINDWLNSKIEYKSDLETFRRIVPDENWSGDIIADKFVAANTARFNYTRYLNDAMKDIRFAVGNIIYYIPHTLFNIYSDARESALTMNNDEAINHISKSVRKIEAEDKVDDDIDSVDSMSFAEFYARRQNGSDYSENDTAVNESIKALKNSDAGFRVIGVEKF